MAAILDAILNFSKCSRRTEVQPTDSERLVTKDSLKLARHVLDALLLHHQNKGLEDFKVDITFCTSFGVNNFLVKSSEYCFPYGPYFHIFDHIFQMIYIIVM